MEKDGLSETSKKIWGILCVEGVGVDAVLLGLEFGSLGCEKMRDVLGCTAWKRRIV